MRRGQDCQQDLFYVYGFKRKANVGERGRLDHKELLEGQCFPSACDACYTVLEDQALHKESSSHQEAGAAALTARSALCSHRRVWRGLRLSHTWCDWVSLFCNT